MFGIKWCYIVEFLFCFHSKPQSKQTLFVKDCSHCAWTTFWSFLTAQRNQLHLHSYETKFRQTLNLSKSNNWGLFHNWTRKVWQKAKENLWTRFKKENLWNIFRKCIQDNLLKICYYPGFYSSLSDEMGLNGGYSSIRSIMGNLSKIVQISNYYLQLNRFHPCFLKLYYVKKCHHLALFHLSGSCKSLDNSKFQYNCHHPI
jgi:hypothetical protein